MKQFTITNNMVAEIAATVERFAGEYPDIRGFHGRASAEGTESLGYVGPYPSMVGFELVVILAGKTAHQACRAGYTFVASDFVDEMRYLLLAIESPRTEAVGRDLVFYWPTVAVVS